MPRAMLSAVSFSRYAAISRARSSSHQRRLRNRCQLIRSSLLDRTQHLVDGAHDPFPAAHFRAQLLAPGSREAVVAHLAVVFGRAPEGGYPAQCHLVFDRKFNMMETAADVTIEERSLGRGGKHVVKQMIGGLAGGAAIFLTGLFKASLGMAGLIQWGAMA